MRSVAASCSKCAAACACRPRPLPEAALEKEPRRLEALLPWSAAATTREEVEAALGRLEGVGGNFGGLGKYHLTLGSLHLRRQNAAVAARAFREAVARAPRSVEAHVALGHFLLTQSDVAGAERAFRTTAELAPAWRRLAEIALAEGKLDKNQKALDALRKSPADVDARFRSGRGPGRG